MFDSTSDIRSSQLLKLVASLIESTDKIKELAFGSDHGIPFYRDNFIIFPVVFYRNDSAGWLDGFIVVFRVSCFMNAFVSE
jgi:hypothetical protein